MSKKMIFLLLTVFCVSTQAIGTEDIKCEMINPDPHLELQISNFANNIASNNIFTQIIEEALRSGFTTYIKELIKNSEKELFQTHVSEDLFKAANIVNTAKSAQAIGEAETELEQYNAIKATSIGIVSLINPAIGEIASYASLFEDVNSTHILVKMNEERLETIRKIELIKKEMAEDEVKKTFADNNNHCLYWNQIQINRVIIEDLYQKYLKSCDGEKVGDTELCLTDAINWVFYSKNQEELISAMAGLPYMTNMGLIYKSYYQSSELVTQKEKRLQQLDKITRDLNKVKQRYLEHWIKESFKINMKDSQKCRTYALNKATDVLKVINKQGLPRICKDQALKNEVLWLIQTIDEESELSCEFSVKDEIQTLKTIDLYLTKNKNCQPVEDVFHDK